MQALSEALQPVHPPAVDMTHAGHAAVAFNSSGELRMALLAGCAYSVRRREAGDPIEAALLLIERRQEGRIDHPHVVVRAYFCQMDPIAVQPVAGGGDVPEAVSGASPAADQHDGAGGGVGSGDRRDAGGVSGGDRSESLSHDASASVAGAAAAHAVEPPPFDRLFWIDLNQSKKAGQKLDCILSALKILSSEEYARHYALFAQWPLLHTAFSSAGPSAGVDLDGSATGRRRRVRSTSPSDVQCNLL